MRWFYDLKLQWKFNLLILLTITGFMVSGLYFYKILSTVQVNGPLYLQIVDGKDLTADILPPPEYIIESLLTVHQMIYHANDNKLMQDVQTINKLKEEFYARHKYWDEHLLEGEMKNTLLHDAFNPAIKFFEMVDHEFIPALENKKIDHARELLNGSLNQLYTEHRVAIDRIVKLSGEWCVANEKNAATITQEGTISVVGIMAVIVGIIVALSILIARIISKSIQVVAKQAEIIANGDLSIEVVQSSNDEIGQLAGSFKNMVENLRETLNQVAEASSAVASASTEISSSTEEMAAGSQEQTSQAGEVASAVEEMTKTIVENSKNASEASSTAHTAKKSAELGGEVVKETVESMKEIADVVNRSAETVKALGTSSDQIGEIVTVIEDIADQTNLLALNAAIEAARAGDQGRGFAVVADEVRKLAERTTKATKEIAGMIKQIQKDTKGAVESMERGTKKVSEGIIHADKAGNSLKEIVGISQKVTDMVAQIAAANEQQSSASEQISKNVEAISTVTQETATGTQQIARTAEDLNKLTENLQQLVAKFQLHGNEEKIDSRHRKEQTLKHNVRQTNSKHVELDYA